MRRRHAPDRGLRRSARISIAFFVVGTWTLSLGCESFSTPADEATTAESTAESVVDAVREDAYLARAEQCRESIAVELRDNWREVSVHFNEAGALRSARRAHFYQLSGDTSRPCAKLLREGKRARVRRPVDLDRMTRLIRLASIYAEDSEVLDDASSRVGVRKQDTALVESTYAHQRRVFDEWERLDRTVQFDLYARQEQNYDDLRRDLGARGASLQLAKVDMVIELRRLRRCYVEPRPELRCTEVFTALSSAHERFFNPDTANPGSEDRSKVFWLATFEADARQLDVILRRNPPPARRVDGVDGLAFDPVVDQAVRRLLRDAETLAFDFP